MTQGKRWGGRRGTTERGRARLGLRCAWAMGGMLALLATVAGGAQAATETWDGGGGDNNWMTDANWLDNTAPVSGDDLVFPAVAARMTNNNDYPSTTLFNSLAINAGGYTLMGNDLGSTAFGSTTPAPLTLTANFDAGTSAINFGFTGSPVGVTAFPTLTKSGTGTLSLGGATDNGFLNATVNAGTLLLAKTPSSATVHALARGGTGLPSNILTVAAGATAQLGGTGGDQINNSGGITLNDGTFDLNGRSETINTLVGTAASIVTNTAPSTTSNFSIGFNNASSILFFGVIKDTGTGIVAITKVGTAALTLNNANNAYSGGTTINAGTLTINSDAALGTLPATPATNLTFSGAGTLQAATGSTVILNANRNITLTGADKIDPNGTTLTINGIISGGGSLAVAVNAGTATAGTLVLAGTNTYTGATTIPGNTAAAPFGAALRLTNPAGLGATSLLTIGSVGNSEVSRLELALTGTNTINRNITTNARNGTAATVQNISGDNTLTGVFTETSGGLNAIFQSDAGAGNKLTLSFSGTSTNTRSIVLQGTGNGEATVPLFSTIGNLTKLGAGTWIISGNNSSSNGTTTISAGTLQIGSGGTSGSLPTGAITNTASLIFNRSDSATVPNVISGAGTLTQAGTGTTILSGTTSNYTGATTVNAGVLQAASPAALGSTSRLTVNTGGTFYFVSPTDPPSLQTLTLAALKLADGSRIGAGLGSSPTGTYRILVNSLADVTGAITVAAIGITGVTPASGSGPYLLVSDPSGGLNGGNYSLVTLNATNFTATLTPAPTDNAINVTVAAATPLTTAYWKGGVVPGAGNVWAASTGLVSNWASDAAGTATALVPSLGTDVIFALPGATNQSNMVLGADMSINSLTINGTKAIPNDTDPFGLNAGNTLTIAAPGFTINPGSGIVTMNAVLDGAGGITKNSSALMTLSAANTYTGATTVGAGVLNIRTATGLGTIAGGTVVASGGTLQLQGGFTVGAEPLTLNGTGASGQNGALVNLLNNNTYNGAVTLGSASTISADADTLTLLTTPTTVAAANATTITGAFDLTLTGAGTGLINDLIATGTGAIIKNGTGTWTVARFNGSSNNTYTGGTSVLQGELIAFGTNTLPLSTSGLISVTSGASLRMRDKATTPDIPNPFKLNGSGINGSGSSSGGALNFINSGAVSLTGTVSLDSDTTIRTDPAGQTTPITFSNVISGPGKLTLLSQASGGGAPNFTLSGANTYSGGTQLTSSSNGSTANRVFVVTLSGGDDRLPTGTTVTFGGTPANGFGTYNASTSLQLGGISQTIGGLQTASGATGAYSVAGNSATVASTLIVNNASANTFGGIIGGTGTGNNNIALTKSGVGTLTLSGANTYTGATTISAGRLNIGDGTSGSITSPVTATGGILGGGTFNGTGTNITGDVAINSGATHAPGTSTAIQTINGAYNNAGLLQVELGGTTPGATTAGGVDGYDQVRAGGASNGNVTLSGTIQTILPNDNFTPVAGTPFVVLVNTGTGTTTVTSPAPNNYTVDSDVDYNPTTNTITSMSGGNDVAIIPITTSVKLIAFGAKSFSDKMWVEWKTGLETDNVGFWVWRQDRLIGRDGRPGGWSKAYRLNPALIAGANLQNNRNADPSGGFGYGWIDTRPLPKSRQVRYWLQDVDTSGKATQHGPVKPVPAQGNLGTRTSSPMVTQLNGSK